LPVENKSKGRQDGEYANQINRLSIRIILPRIKPPRSRSDGSLPLNKSRTHKAF
jgi:hypothetical protein